eukprot:CAMPEP_0114486572 /NCGR_PEP_ID=MMETSP0109-20121206/286_1 /TAXON_ID=29199 /ORGANISM="Chlorarachnion reptans, Strain CCCM449" /LENGTH=57 /DNA_ID=CAMNT_0001662743 /DNA_START=435 /DNA_END=608 /DNA_ORIENTATION=+
MTAEKATYTGVIKFLQEYFLSLPHLAAALHRTPSGSPTHHVAIVPQRKAYNTLLSDS